jgi:hypothetical protein
MEAATTNNGITESEEDASPCGITLWENNSTSVESVFHGASRKGAKLAKFGANKNLFFFAPLASWHEKSC